MNRARLWALLAAAAALLCAFLFLAGGRLLSQAENLYRGSVQLRWTEGVISARETEQMTRDDRQYTAWTQESSRRAESPETGRFLLTDSVYYFGGGSGVFDLAEEGTCAISADVAERLWHSGAVSGQRIRLGGEDFVVARLLPGLENTVVARVGANSDRLFDVMEVRVPSPSAQGLDAEALAAELGKDGGLVRSYEERLAGLEKIRNAPFWIWCVLCCGWLLRRARREWKGGGGPPRQAEGRRLRTVRWPAEVQAPAADRPTWRRWLRTARAAWCRSPRPAWVRLALLLAPALLLPVLCFLLLGSPVHFPQALLPSRWSDFSFWQQALSDIQSSRQALEAMADYKPDSLLADTEAQLCAFSLLMTLLPALLLFLRCVRKRSC